MVNNKNIILTEEDKKMIDNLKVSPYLKIANIGRKNKINNIISIADISNEKLKDLLGKIDMYIDEICRDSGKSYEKTGDFAFLDEMWMLDYFALKDSIKKRLEE